MSKQFQKDEVETLKKLRISLEQLEDLSSLNNWLNNQQSIKMQTLKNIINEIDLNSADIQKNSKEVIKNTLQLCHLHLSKINPLDPAIQTEINMAISKLQLLAGQHGINDLVFPQSAQGLSQKAESQSPPGLLHSKANQGARSESLNPVSVAASSPQGIDNWELLKQKVNQALQERGYKTKFDIKEDVSAHKVQLMYESGNGQPNPVHIADLKVGANSEIIYNISPQTQKSLEQTKVLLVAALKDSMPPMYINGGSFETIKVLCDAANALGLSKDSLKVNTSNTNVIEKLRNAGYEAFLPTEKSLQLDANSDPTKKLGKK